MSNIRRHSLVWAFMATLLLIAAGGLVDGAIAQSGATDYDTDNDGLIEVANLAQFNAIRWDTDADGQVSHDDQSNYSAAYPNAAADMGCPASGCVGYELTANLDFDTNGSGAADSGDTYWNQGKGWDPFHFGVSASRQRTFNGNGHTISNLYIENDQLESGGLFDDVKEGATVTSLRLQNVSVDRSGPGQSLIDGHTGALAGIIYGSADKIAVSGSVHGVSVVGGLAGEFVGVDPSAISDARIEATVTSTGDSQGQGQTVVGGLIGIYRGGKIKNSLVTGRVASDVSGARIGSLVGWVTPNNSPDVADSYWDSQTTTQTVSSNGMGKTTAQLQTPTSATGIYANWSVDDWYFGGSYDYPRLRVGPVDYDIDNDSLIEVSDLGQLDAMRWDLDGDGAVDSAGGDTVYANAYFNPVGGMGCPSKGCDGYELTTDLNFDTNGDGKTDVAGDRFWNNGEGWEPIGGSSSGSDQFETDIAGNGHVIRNLFIDRTGVSNARMGLLGGVIDSAEVSNLGLDSVNISGYRNVGALAGVFDGKISGVFVTGDIEGHEIVGGIVGSFHGSISESYFDGVVSGDSSVGGLAGVATPVSITGHEINNSYATGTVRGGDLAAGLVAHMGLGVNGGLNSIDNSYSTAEVTGWKGSHQSLAGLVGSAHDDTKLDCGNSYWDTQASGQTDSACGDGKTTAELKAPTSATGIYAQWDGEVWDFGHQLEYPALMVDFNGDGAPTWLEFGDQDRLGLPPSDHAPAVAPVINGYNVELGKSDDDLGKTTVYVKPDITDEVTAVAYRIAAATGDQDITCGPWRSYGPAEVDDDWSIIAPYTTGTPVEIPGDLYGGHPGTVVINHADVEIGRVYAYCLQLASANSEGRGPVVQEIIQLPYTDYDLNDDGLIEVADLAQLNAIRWDLNGDGYVATGDQKDYFDAFTGAASGMGCPESGCSGYELTVDLDFDTNHNGIADDGDAYWNGGEGWKPIGKHTSWSDQSTEFRATFSGNGHVIRNLFIASSSHGIGLFGWTDRLSVMENVGLENVDVTGGEWTGGLIGAHEGALTSAYVTGKVSGSNYVGGLAGGISSGGKINTVYSSADVSGNDYVGGMIGNSNSSGHTSNVYATGNVTGNSYVGGLAGYYVHEDMSNGYSIGRVIGHHHTGGLIGYASSGQADASYWDTQTSQQHGSASGIGRTTAQLQGPTSATGIYQLWGTDKWDFGTSSQYPALKADFNGDGKATSGEFGNQRGDYDADDDGLIEVEDLAQLYAIRWDQNGDGAADTPGDDTQYLAAFPTPEERMGCPSSGCDGYELSFDLNFDTNDNGHADHGDTYWNGGAGWSPISSYSGVLEGNGRAIYNLYVNRTERGRTGLFSQLTDGALVRNLGLVNVDITSNGDAGAFAGLTTRASISNSYATGLVTITSNNDSVGGFVGEASGRPSGHDSIRDSYSVVNVTAKGDGNRTGGLVGSMHVNQSSHTRIVNSFAAGMVRSKDITWTGGLVGKTGIPESTIIASYWDTQTTGWHTSADDHDGNDDHGEGKTSAELKAPTSATGIYSAWDPAAWDFGAVSEYPALKYDTNGDGAATVAEFGEQPRTADEFVHDLDLDEDGLIEVSTLEQLNAIRWDPDGDGVAADSDASNYADAFVRWRTGLAAECVGTHCAGYELTTDLYFNTHTHGQVVVDDPFWNDGKGWLPIASFSGVFEGHGRAIGNLYINRTGSEPAGLFGQLTNGADVRNLALTAVHITSGGDAGAVAGRMTDSGISRSYATGLITGNGDHASVGGLAGDASGRLSGKDTIQDSYSLVKVTANGDGSAAGGLAGVMLASGASQPQIVNSFAAGLVQAAGPGLGGGLVGRNDAEQTQYTNSYWDTQTTAWPTSPGGSGKTQQQLQSPTSTHGGIYGSWSASVWDIGDSSQYPGLKYDTDGNGSATVAEFGDQPLTATIPSVNLDTDNNGLMEVSSRAQLGAVRWDLNGDGTPVDSNAGDFRSAFNITDAGAVPCVGVPCHGYELVSDVDLEQQLWTPIGDLDSGKWDATFRGNGHTISHLKVSRGGTAENVGLFGETTKRSVLEGVHIYSPNVETWGGNHDDNRQNSAGALVGFNRGIVRESGMSYIWGDICRISGRNVAGGLVGGNEGVVERSWARCGDVNSKKAGGGLVGFNHPGGIVRDSWADGLVLVKRKGWKKGALVGRNFGTVEKSFSLGETERDNRYHGPLTGQQGGTVTDSYYVGHHYDRKYGGINLTDQEMKTPRVAHPGFFAYWDRELWHLGNKDQYSALVVDANHDGFATPWEIGPQRPSDSVTAKPVKVGSPAISNDSLTLQFRQWDDGTASIAAVHYRIARVGSACHRWFGDSNLLMGRSDGRASLSMDENGLYTLTIKRNSSDAFDDGKSVCVDVNFLNTEGKGYKSSQRWRDIHMQNGGG